MKSKTNFFGCGQAGPTKREKMEELVEVLFTLDEKRAAIFQELCELAGTKTQAEKFIRLMVGK